MSSLIPFLRRVGVSSDQILLALELQAEEKAAKDRVRKAKWRNNNRKRDDVTRVPVTRGTIKEIPPTPPKENNINNNIPFARARGARLPDNWHPPENLWEKAQTFGLSVETLRFETGAFRDHWLASSGRNATKRDWGRAWLNWMREALRRSRPRQPVLSRTQIAVQDALRELDGGENANGFGGPCLFETSDEPIAVELHATTGGSQGIFGATDYRGDWKAEGPIEAPGASRRRDFGED